MNRRNLYACLFNQCIDQLIVHRMAGDQRGRHRHVKVVLTEERLQHLHWLCIVHMHRKVRTVAQVPAATHHRQVHAGFAALHFHSQDVYILIAHRVHGLAVEHFRQGAHLIAQLCGLFKLQTLRMRHHALLN